MIVSKNPYNEEVLKKFDPLPDHAIEKKLNLAEKTYLKWRNVDIEQRTALLDQLGKVLKRRKDEIAQLMTLEMGKILSESVAEVEKSAWLCEYYAENAEEFLADNEIETDASKSFVNHEPLGTILGVMPWNFPLWQVMRFAVPAVTAGNTALLKHASNVPQMSQLIEELFIDAGYQDGVFQSLLINSDQVSKVIESEVVQGISLTGSEKAGSIVASQAARLIKKSVLELGGSDPAIIMEDADLELAVNRCLTSRMINTGQSCIAAKRFIVHDNVYDEFISMYQEKFENLNHGDPLEATTKVGPLANEQILETIEDQVNRSVQQGAELLTGGKRIADKGYFYAPTLLTNVTQEMPVFIEETFGPVTSVMTFERPEQAVKIANSTNFGLGASIWSEDTTHAKRLASEIDAGSVFINELVKSDPRLPFGGIKRSGYGRELGREGIREFVNIKTIWVN